MKRILLFTAAATLLMACGTHIPEEFTETDELPNIYPDYTNVTVPVNIAPLTFEFDGEIVLTDPLGIDARLYEIIKDRVSDSL